MFRRTLEWLHRAQRVEDLATAVSDFCAVVDMQYFAMHLKPPGGLPLAEVFNTYPADFSAARRKLIEQGEITDAAAKRAVRDRAGFIWQGGEAHGLGNLEGFRPAIDQAARFGICAGAMVPVTSSEIEWGMVHCGTSHACTYARACAVMDDLSTFAPMLEFRRVQLTNLSPILPPELTANERRVLRLLLNYGGSRKRVARDLGLSESRVKQLLESAHRKLGTSGGWMVAALRAEALGLLLGGN